MDDFNLLKNYIEQADEAAFEKIVKRHIDLVWSTAYRVTGDADAARDVVQTIFADLARKATRIQNETHLTGWLHRAASLSAAKIVRSNIRRLKRERLAMEFHNERNDASNQPDDRVISMLDHSINQLNRKDRQAILLRFFGQKSLAEIGASLEISDDAAQKRVFRALEKLRLNFRRQGITVSTLALSSTLQTGAAQFAPTGLAAAVTTSSLAAGAMVSGSAPSILAIKSQITIMKTKLAIGALATITSITPLVIQQNRMNDHRENQILMRQEIGNLSQLRREHSRLRRLENQAAELAHLREDHKEMEALRQEWSKTDQKDLAEKQHLGRILRKLKAETEETNDYVDQLEAEQKADAIAISRVNDLKQIGLAARIFTVDNQDQLPKSFTEIERDASHNGPNGNIDWGLYEFMKHDRELQEYESNIILFREKEARQMPDGTWQRAYAMIDGSVKQIKSNDGDFSEWEQSHIARNPQ